MTPSDTIARYDAQLLAARKALAAIDGRDCYEGSIHWARALRALADLTEADQLYSDANDVAAVSNLQFDGDDLVTLDPDLPLYNAADRLFEERSAA